MSAETAGAPPPARRPASFWALAALLCAAASACPLAALLGLLLSVVALLDLARRPQRGGRRMARIALVVSVVALAGWGTFAWWWQVHAREPMLEGPIAAIQAGQRGDVAAFQDAFVDGRAVPETEAAAFLSALSRRYGRLLASAQRRAKAPAAADFRRVRIPYSLRFESGGVEAEAEFVVTEPGAGLVLRFAWVVVRDPDRGDLVYPAAAAPTIDAPPSTPHDSNSGG